MIYVNGEPQYAIDDEVQAVHPIQKEIFPPAIGIVTAHSPLKYFYQVIFYKNTIVYGVNKLDLKPAPSTLAKYQQLKMKQLLLNK